METEKIVNKGFLWEMESKKFEITIPPFDPNVTLREMIDDVLRQPPTAPKMPKRVPKRKK